MDELQREYPELVSVENIGKSYEGREIMLMKVSKPGNEPKQAFWMDSSIFIKF